MMDPARAGLAQRIYDRLTGADRRRERAAIIRQLPDRWLLIDVYIPAFAAEAGRILWVGCRAYTLDDYKALESGGGEVWTTDLDPRAEKWGRRGRHRTGDLCGVDEVFADITFDAIICNGVFGYGVDTPDQQLAAMRAMAMILRPGGRLLLGWNTDKIADPVVEGRAWLWCDPVSFASQQSRVRFDDVTHTYDTLVRKRSMTRSAIPPRRP